MSKKSVFCTVASPLQAYQIITCLEGEGFSNDHISVLFPDKSGTHEDTGEPGAAVQKGDSRTEETDAVRASQAVQPAQEQTHSVPEYSSFVAAGRVAATLAHAGEEDPGRGVTRALIGMGIPNFEAVRYERKVTQGSVLIAVQPDTADEARKAWDLLKQAGAHDILAAGVASVSYSRTEREGAPYVLLPVR